MAADSANRDDVLIALADRLRTALVPATVDQVIEGETENVEVDSLIMVLPAGSKRLVLGIGNTTKWHNFFMFEVLSFVVKANTFSTTTGGGNWTFRDVETQLSALDKAIADVIADSRDGAGDWTTAYMSDDYSNIVDGRGRPYEAPDSQQTKYKIESRLIIVEYIEG